MAQLLQPGYAPESSIPVCVPSATGSRLRCSPHCCSQRGTQTPWSQISEHATWERCHPPPLWIEVKYNQSGCGSDACYLLSSLYSLTDEESHHLFCSICRLLKENISLYCLCTQESNPAWLEKGTRGPHGFFLL